MKKYWRNFNLPFYLLLILIFALGLRLLWLDRVPIAIADDELDYILDAKAIFLDGRDLSGEWSPLSLTTPPHQVPKAELPALLISPLIGPMKFSLFSARLPYVIWGLVFLIFLFLTAQRVFGKEVALWVALVTAINPWGFYFSRTAFEAPLALTFYLIALFIIVSFRKWKLLFCLPFLFLAFLSYVGTKIIFLPFVLITCFYSWWVINQKKFSKQYLLIVFGALVIFGWFLASFKTHSVSLRTDELLGPFHPIVTQTVDTERRLSLGNSLTVVFSNKLVVWAKLILEKYLGIFSADFFFLHGEGRATYSLWVHGMFYYLDFIFLVFGFCFLFLKDRRLWLFLVALVLLAPIPSALSAVGVEYALRAVLLPPVIILFIGLGIGFVGNLRQSRAYRWGIISVISLLYLVHLLNFLNIYFFRNPLYNSEGFGFSKRVLFRYVDLVRPTVEKIYVIGGELNFLKGYLFYSGKFDRETLDQVRKSITQGNYSWGNIYFSTDCPKDLGINDLVILPPNSDCLGKKKYAYWLSIAQLGDGGEVFRIVNDSLCSKFPLNRYPYGIKFADFSKIENSSSHEFCQKFITDLSGYREFKRKTTSDSGEK